MSVVIEIVIVLSWKTVGSKMNFNFIAAIASIFGQVKLVTKYNMLIIYRNHSIDLNNLKKSLRSIGVHFKRMLFKDKMYSPVRSK